MDACTPRPRWRSLLRWLPAAPCALIVASGCAGPAYVAGYNDLGPPVAKGAAAVASNVFPVTSNVFPPRPDQPPVTNANEVVLVDRKESPVVPSGSPGKPVEPATPHVVPITLDVVLRLAEQHNPRIALARSKLHESQLTTAQGALGWLPNIYAGIAYYRHEGGIQDFTGRLLHSSTGAALPAVQIQSELDLREGVFQLIDLERRVWQQKAELSQVNNEVLMEAALTYIDLLAARRGEGIAAELEKYEQKLLDRAESLVKSDLGYARLVEAVKATLSNRQQLTAQLKQKANAATAKLVYLLGLPPGTCLQPVDLILAPIELVDSSPAACDLVAQALANGPGVHELEGILSLVQLAMEKTYGSHNLLPIVGFNLAEGPFGAGPGGTLAWDNRLDVGLQFRWNLTQLCQTEFKRTLIRSKQEQAMLNYEDLRGKLAAGVAESKDAILFGREQIGLAAMQIRHANANYRLSDRRLQEALRDTSAGDVLITIRGLEQAHFNYLQAISGHNKAQVRLMMLLGGGPAQAAERHPAPAPPPTLLPPPKGEKPAGEKRE